MKVIDKRFSKAKGFLLGRKGEEFYYLCDFKWDCGWYWGGGYVHIHNRNKVDYHTHTHFDSLFLNNVKDCNYEGNVIDMFDYSTLNIQEWWRLMDLMKQFYTIRKSAEVFHCGGHMSAWHRSSGELNPEMNVMLNHHLANVVLPEVRKLFNASEYDYGKLMNFK